MAKTRFFYIDAIKAFAIVLVCSYHFSVAASYVAFDPSGGWISPNSIRRLIWGTTTICVPLFFMASGALFLTRERLDPKRIIGTLAKVVGTYILWRFFTIVILECWNGILFEEGFRRFLSIVLFNGEATVTDTFMWFIPVYAAFLFLSPFLHQVFVLAKDKSNYRSFLYFFLGVMFVLYFLIGDVNSVIELFPAFHDISVSRLSDYDPFFQLVGVAITYSLAGALLHEKRDRLSSVPTWAFLVGFILGMALLWFRWNMESMSIGQNWDSVFNGYGSLGGFTLSVSFFLICMKLCQDVRPVIPAPSFQSWKDLGLDTLKRLVVSLGSNTIGIYYVHWIIRHTVLTLAYPVLVEACSGIPLIATYMSGLVLCLVSLGIVLLLKKIPIMSRSL